MNKKLCSIIVALIILSPFFGCKAYGADWDKTDTALEVTWLVLHVLDYGTTLDIADMARGRKNSNNGSGVERRTKIRIAKRY